MSFAIHPLDLFWALLGVAGCCYPIKHVWPHIRVASTVDFVTLMLILGFYPAAIAVFHLTPFDLGLVYGLMSFLPAIFFFSMVRYLGVQLPYERGLRWGLYSMAACYAVFGLSNPWHGQFAVFPAHVAGVPHHLMVEEQALWGLQLLQVFTVVLTVGTLLTALVQFSRARFNVAHYVMCIGLPSLALWSLLAAGPSLQLFGVSVNGFLLVTSIILASTNYAIVKRRFLGSRVVTRSSILSIMPEAMVVLSPTRFIVDANLAFERLVGRSCVNQLLLKVLPELDQALCDIDSDFEFELVNSNGRRIFQVAAQSINRLTKVDAQALLLLRDVTSQQVAVEALEESQRELREANAALERLSMTDPLTGLKNRRYFQDRLYTEYQRAQRAESTLALVSIDIDHFKLINDSFGHGVGDLALCHVARVLENQCRYVDTLARVGGEEFMVLLVDASPKHVNANAQRLCRALRQTPFMLDNGRELVITASLGSSVLGAGDTVDSALQRADEALYAAKSGGRDRVVAL